MSDEGTPPVEGEGTPPVEGEGTPPVEGEGTPPAEGEGTPPAEGEGTPPAEGDKEFVLPEGVELADDEITAIKGLFTDAGLSVDQQQQIVDFMAEQGEASQAAQAEAYDSQVAKWDTELHTEFGDKYDENVGIAKEAAESFGMLKVMDESGLGNNPVIIKGMLKLGKLLKEDNPGAGGHQANKPLSNVDILYPNEK